jgi:deuterolysin
MYDFSEDAFTTLQPGESFTSAVNIAALHDVTGGEYTISTIGAIPYAAADTTEIAGSVLYESNVLTLSLSEDDIAIVSRAVPLLEKRTILRSCSGTQDTQHRAALSQLISVAQSAANAARSGSSTKFAEFFRTTTTTARSNVAARYDAIARESSSTTSGATNYYCTDPYGYCSPNVLAYALPSQNLISNCPAYYTLTTFTSTCRQQDKVTTALHEFTHTPGVFSPGTQDYAYGYSASTALSSTQALNNADTYALYANGECFLGQALQSFHTNQTCSHCERLLNGFNLSSGILSRQYSRVSLHNFAKPNESWMVGNDHDRRSA